MSREVINDGKKSKEWAAKSLKEKMKVDCDIVRCRENGAVVAVKLESEEGKREIMRNKHKLTGERIFIENDLSSGKKEIYI